MSWLYSKALGMSLLLHTVILIFLLYSPSHTAKNYTIKKPIKPVSTEVIKTVAISSETIESAINKIKADKQRKQQQELAKSNRLKALAEQARKQRILEQQKLNKIKRNQKKALSKQRALLAKQQKEQALIEKNKQKLKRLKARLAKEEAEERKRIAKLKAEQAKQLEAKRLEEEKRKQEAQHQAELKKRQQQQLVDAEVDRYKALIIRAISQNWILPPGVDQSLSCQFKLSLEPSGEVKKVELIKSSGDPVLDRSAQTAIYHASPLPVPTTPAAFNVFKVVSLTVRPERET